MEAKKKLASCISAPEIRLEITLQRLSFLYRRTRLAEERWLLDGVVKIPPISSLQRKLRCQQVAWCGALSRTNEGSSLNAFYQGKIW